MHRVPFVYILLPLVLTIWLCRERLIPAPIGQTSVAHYVVCVTDYPVARARSWRCTVQVLQAADSMAQMCGRRFYLYVPSTGDCPDAGDTLHVLTAWHDGDSIGMFDYGLHLRRQGLSGLGYTQSWQCLGKGDLPWWKPASMQHKLRQRYQHLGITGNELQTVSALTLGYRDQMDRQQSQRFQRAGAAHVLAVSGLHVAMLVQVLMAVLTLMGRCRPMYVDRRHQVVLTTVLITLLLAYMVLTGLSASVMRTTIMVCMLLIGRAIHRRRLWLNTMLMAAVLILLMRPTDLWSIGFWLSFTATAAMVWLAPRAKGYWLQLMAASLAATAGTLPLTIYYFGQLSNYFLLTNLLVVPLAGVILVLGLMTLTIGWVPGVGTICAWLLRQTAWFMNAFVAWMDSLPYAAIDVHCSAVVMIALYAVIIVWIIVWSKINIV